MANSKLLFFDKRGEPLNYEYVGPTGATPADYKFLYESANSSTTPGTVDITSLGSNQLVFNSLDKSNFDLNLWATEIEDFLLKGATVTLKISVLNTSQVLECKISSVTIGSDITLDFSSVVGNTIISAGKRLYFETTYENRPGGYYKGRAYFEEVSAGLFENFQIFILQELRTSSGSAISYGYPHADIGYTTDSEPTSFWRTRWESNNYGNVDVTDIIFTYKIIEPDNNSGGDPVIYNYPNIVYETNGATGDYYEDGYLVTSSVVSASLGINVAINGPDEAAEVYERKLIVEELTSDGPLKILEVDFYGEIVGNDERLDVLTKNLGRAFFPDDSVILRDHDPDEPLPDFVEINEKRKELMVAGEEIFPYIGSYKGLVGALKFFGYQDLRIKEYWLNIDYAQNTLSPLQATTEFLREYKNQPNGYSQVVLIRDILDNQNSGKYRLIQTYGPNDDGDYVLDVSSENTIVPSNVFKKTSFFGLYYDLVKETSEEDDYGYPITEDAFMFTQDEVLLKLFALKERLKKTYLPLNARIIDITGEGVYFNVYNTKSWMDSVNRFDVDSGFNVNIKANPDYGFIEDLRAFYVRRFDNTFQLPRNYNDVEELTFDVVGATGNAFTVSGYSGYNPQIELERAKRYVIKNTSSDYQLYITRDPFLGVDDPYGIENNGATGSSEIIFDVHIQEESQLYYYNPDNPYKMNGIITLTDAQESDFGNTVNPHFNGQKYTKDQIDSMIDAISGFYRKKQDGEIVGLGDGMYDPPIYLDPATGKTHYPPVGMPVILSLELDEYTWDDMDLKWSALTLPVMKVGDSVYVKAEDVSGATGYIGQVGTITSVDYPNGQYVVDTPLGSSTFEEFALYISKQNKTLLTWDNIDLSTFSEIEWIITKDATQDGSPYNFSFRGPAIYYYKLPHFLPYTGSYKVTCNIYDAYNFKNTKIEEDLVVASPRTINIDAWSRYREAEFNTWDGLVKTWDDYDGMWEYPAEGKTYDELLEELPKELLNYVTYGNSAYEGQNLKVWSITDPTPASAGFTYSQPKIDIESIISYRIGSLAQYSIAEVRTSTPHGFDDGATVFIENSLPEINGDWDIEIPTGATGYTFRIPVVLVPQAGINFKLAQLSVDPLFYPSQKVSGGGEISISIGGRDFVTAGLENDVRSTTKTIISTINKENTSPNYLASSNNYDDETVTIEVLTDVEDHASMNGTSFSVTASGGVTLVSYDESFSGGVNAATGYIDWTEDMLSLPNENLRLWGTKRLNWDSLYDVTWDDLYAHGWSDFEYNNDWLGGFNLYGIKIGDYVKVSPSSEYTPFPVGVTMDGGTASSGPLTLQNISDQLNNSADENITRFYYRPYPSNAYADYLSTEGPTGIGISNTVGATSAYPAPPSVPGANPVNYPDFTYATGA